VVNAQNNLAENLKGYASREGPLNLSRVAGNNSKIWFVWGQHAAQYID
jgi:hypothetical protein